MRKVRPDWVTPAVFLVGLVLFGVGLGLAWLPLGLLGPGCVLMAISLFGDGKRGAL